MSMIEYGIAEILYLKYDNEDIIMQLIESLVEEDGLDIDDLAELAEFCQEFVEEWEELTEGLSSEKAAKALKWGKKLISRRKKQKYSMDGQFSKNWPKKRPAFGPRIPRKKIIYGMKKRAA